MPPSRPVVNGKRPTRSATSRSTNLKRKQSGDDDHPSARSFKKTKVEPGNHHVAIPSLNKAPTDVLAVFVFGNGDAGELGLGPAIQEAGRPRLNPFLKRVVQLSCGGMHTVALTRDNEIVTWGVNDNGALGRSTDWHGGLRDIDGDADQNGELSPLESVPTEIPDHFFPPGTKFVQVAAGDSCSFVLTDTGLVYGWGTFKVRFLTEILCELCSQSETELRRKRTIWLRHQQQTHRKIIYANFDPQPQQHHPNRPRSQPRPRPQTA
jgi:regulator of chromosome condensation